MDGREKERRKERENQGEEGRWRDRPEKTHNERLHLFPLRLGFGELIAQELSIVTAGVLFMAYKCTVFNIQGRLLLAC